MSSWLEASSWKSLAATMQSAASTAVQQAREAKEVASSTVVSIKKSIEDDLTSEYEKAQANAGAQSTDAPPPMPTDNTPTAFERITNVGVALLNP